MAPIKPYLPAVAFFVAADVLHWYLNSVYQPFTGRLDTVLHIFGGLGAVLYLVVAVLIGYVLRRQVHDRFSSQIRPLAILLIALCVFEFVYMKSLGATQSGSASYSQMFPMFVAGVAPGFLTYIVSAVSVSSRALFIILTTLALLWICGPFAIDAMNAVEGGARGTTNYVQNLPVVGVIYMILVWVFALALFPALVALIPLVIVGLFAVYRANGVDGKLATLSIFVSVLLLNINLVNWGGFIWD